ncbi:MAG: nuclear transport factor 2 family protein [Anaerolineales bacterium]|nr:nuclear transport factor 2 family protein [Anaerolineales bacterium]
MDDILELERHGWQALSAGGDAGKMFYEHILREDALMLFPGGMRIQGRQQILESLGGRPWASFEILEPELIDLTPKAKTIVYRVEARREAAPLYEAHISSTYVFEDETWKLVLHQQSQV